MISQVLSRRECRLRLLCLLYELQLARATRPFDQRLSTVCRNCELDRLVTDLTESLRLTDEDRSQIREWNPFLEGAL